MKKKQYNRKHIIQHETKQNKHEIKDEKPLIIIRYTAFLVKMIQYPIYRTSNLF